MRQQDVPSDTGKHLDNLNMGTITSICHRSLIPRARARGAAPSDGRLLKVYILLNIILSYFSRKMNFQAKYLEFQGTSSKSKDSFLMQCKLRQSIEPIQNRICSAVITELEILALLNERFRVS